MSGIICIISGITIVISALTWRESDEWWARLWPLLIVLGLTSIVAGIVFFTQGSSSE